MSLKVNEVFYSIQGESSHAGRPCIFVRLSGCNLRCSYCDTQEAFYEGEQRSIPQLLDAIEFYNCKLVEITGGEPLLQDEVVDLSAALLTAGYEVLMETSGSCDISVLPTGVKVILDIKTPDSAMAEKNLWSNLEHLGADAEIKFVLNSEADYHWSRGVVAERLHHFAGPIFFSPVRSAVDPRDLAAWICRDGLDVRLQLQLHRTIWGDAPEGSKGSEA